MILGSKERGRGFWIERSDAGVTLVVSDVWTQEAQGVAESGAVDGLDLNYAKGFKDTNLQFIQDWPLKSVRVLARTVKDVSPLYRLSGTLESVSLQTSPSATVDLSRLPGLNSLSAQWVQIRESIRVLPGLCDLFLLGYDNEDLDALGSNQQLERLRFKDRPRLRSLNGLAGLPSLRHLGVYLAAHLTDIDALRDLEPSHLEELHLESCPLEDLRPVETARSLRFLNASNCGDIASLSPIEDLTQLEVLWLFGTTRIVDSDLSPVAGLPLLRELRMQSRKTYLPLLEEIQASIARRFPTPQPTP